MNEFNNFEKFDSYLQELWGALQVKIDRMVKENKSAHVSAEGVYDNIPVDWWTSGFWPGILWIMYDMTKKKEYHNAAWEWDVRIEQCFIEESRLHHDVGFQFLPTAVIKHKITGDQDARRRGLQAANFLSGRFNIAGNYLRAWNDQNGWAIIDSSMNISLLFWAAEEIGDPRFKHIAKAHADTVLKNFIREDGSVCHIASFDAESGEFIESLGGQGYDPHSAWSRGQAWAIYGMANTYKYTGEVRYLRAAQKVAHFFLAALPDDYVPYWDFRVPNFDGEPRDTSAAACAASGLIEIANHLPEQEGRMYKKAAKRIIHSLTNHYATWDQPEYEGLLREGVGNRVKNKNVNVSLIYGDYFYIEAIAKLLGWENNIF
ncbi:glycoside hydrolase family 88 protein [Vallitalea okinawensis]|uniref:glycoside hydrolase family 88 protein n=1 Tax=Vallitalea okinawensis TaxID=2078660 RepID=UPI001FA8FDD8|nr:glycoside hydrolase family 88 protein [Vallitalea okinawensis]